MPCFHPLQAYYSLEGFGRLVFDAHSRKADLKRPVIVPCGRCIGCRLERSRQWALRCVHEASLHDWNDFLTLTYNDESVPRLDEPPFLATLRLEDFQKFMKRLRKRFPSDTIRYYMCGEYGAKFSRPHYHCCLFGFSFPDKDIVSFSGDQPIYRSAILEDLWPFGFSSIGSVTFDSAAYTARYITKKFLGDPDERDDFYRGRQPEFTLMSRRPAIAKEWVQRFSSDVYPKDFVTIRGGVKCRPPRYYDNLFKKNHEEVFYAVKEKRVMQASSADVQMHQTPDRLIAREKRAELTLKQKNRSFEK